jgi:predicted tellurium resistance membrane protein TerC
MVVLIVSQFLGVISTTAAIFSIDSVVAAPGAIAGVVIALFGGLLIIFAGVLRWHKKLSEVLERTTPFWISMGRWIRIMLTSSETWIGMGVPSPDLPMEQVPKSNSTVV